MWSFQYKNFFFFQISQFDKDFTEGCIPGTINVKCFICVENERRLIFPENLLTGETEQITCTVNIFRVEFGQ